MYYVQRDYMDEVRAQLVERLLDQLVDIARALTAGPSQVAFGGLDLKREDRIMQVIEDWESGILDEMAIVSPRQYRAVITQFRRDLTAVAPELAESSPSFTPNETGRFLPAAAATGSPPAFGGL